MKWYPYGHDFGNSTIGGVTVINGFTRTLNLPTAFAPIDATAMSNLGVQMQADSHIIQLDGESMSYSVGELTLQQFNEHWNGRGDTQRYKSSYSKRGMLTVAGTLIPDREFGLYVIAGLPAETYIKNNSLRQDIKECLDGKHVFSLDGGETWRTAIVEVANVVMEGAGALVAYGDTALAKEERGVIDIGGRTTDLYAGRSGQALTDQCKGKPLGVEAVAAIVQNSFESKYGFPLTQAQVRALLHASVSQASYPSISAYGRDIRPSEMDGMTKEAIAKIGQDILSFVADAWRQGDSGAVAASFKQVLLIGGGTFYFLDTLKARIPHLLRVSDPIHANAIGYCALAAQLYERRSKQSSTSLSA